MAEAAFGVNGSNVFTKKLQNSSKQVAKVYTLLLTIHLVYNNISLNTLSIYLQHIN